MSKKNWFSLALIILVAIVIFIASRESTVTYNSDSIKFGGAYGTTIAMDSIQSVQLRESLPTIHRRTNGIGIFGIRKGYFTLAEYDRARLLVHSETGPYIVIKTEAEVVIVNFKDPEQTRTEYQRIAAAK